MRASVLLLLAACGSPRESPDAAGDAAVDIDATADAVPPGFTWPTCGSQTFDQTLLYAGNHVAVAADGTVFHNQYDGGEEYIARIRPGQPAEPTWAHAGSGATGVTALMVDHAGTPYALISDGNQTQLARVTPAIVPIGPAVATTNGPTSIAETPDGILIEAGFQGLARVDLATGARTAISQPVQMSELYFVGARTARGVSYDHGLVEIALDADVMRATYTTIFAFDMIALQATGLDETGRVYAILHESSADKLVRFDGSFRTRETLYMYPTVPIALGRFAFGRGALRCDVLVAGFSIAHVSASDTPAVP